MITDTPNLSEAEVLRMNTQALAFVGDAAYELLIRKNIISRGFADGDTLHRAAVKYVKASAQALVIKTIITTLPEQEQTLVKRARNRKTRTKPKNADAIEYKWATALEALMGFYYLTGQMDNIVKTVEKAIEIVDGV